MPSAIPIAAATPIGGAPRITIIFVALAAAGAVMHWTYTSADGSLLWSTITITSSLHTIVGRSSSYCLTTIDEGSSRGFFTGVLHGRSHEGCSRRFGGGSRHAFTARPGPPQESYREEQW